jgi:hypothetical protein
MKTLHQPSDRFWTQYGTVSAAVTPDEARHLIHKIAAEIGCKATICQDEQDYCSDNERVIDALNETGADDRPAVDEAPFVDGFSFMKKCGKCKQLKPLEKFGKDRYRKDGHCYSCKSCIAEGDKKYRRANSAKVKEKNRRYYQDNSEKERERARQYKQDNPEKSAERNRKWRQANRETYNERKRRYYQKNREKDIERKRKWQQANPEKVRERNRKWYRANPESSKARNHTRRARKFGNGGRYTAAEWRAVKAFYGYRCLACDRKEPEIKLSPDHVRPLAKGGDNSIMNIQPLCLSCNHSKQTKEIDYRGAIYNKPDPRTAAQRDADMEAAEWRDTYQTLLP